MIHFGSKFTFVHIPKTGGLWIADILKRHFEVTAEYHPHMMPFEPQDVPIIAVTRNPHDWWESWVTWGRFYPDKDPYYSAVMVRGDRRPIDEIVNGFKARLPIIEREHSLPFVVKMAAQRIGPLTARIRELSEFDVHWVEFENLRESWIHTLESLGLMTNDLRVEILTTPAYNKTNKPAVMTVDVSDLEPCHGI